jgi:hypothetical protein
VVISRTERPSYSAARRPGTGGRAMTPASELE